MDIESQYSESSSITFEWTFRGLKTLFDSTKGDKKSKVNKSARFGNDMWQILFYANAGQTKDGTESGGFVSLYLSCEVKISNVLLIWGFRWVRNGVFKFSFELRNVEKAILCNVKEAHNHTFTYKTANWGWAQFARRDNVYYQSLSVKAQDAFVIICTITSSPSSLPLQNLPPRQQVPKSLLDTVGELLDDPTYSDVQFIIPRRGQILGNGRRIWASKRLLQRAEYFQTMFSSHFAEGSMASTDPARTPQGLDQESPQLLTLDEFEDSDNEEGLEGASQKSSPRISTTEGSLILLPDSNVEDFERFDPEGLETSEPMSQALLPTPTPDPRQEDGSLNTSKMVIAVRDAAYTTYRAMLYYIYTDNIVFAPLSSSFLTTPHDTTATPADSIPSTPSEGGQLPGAARRHAHREQSSTRAEWIKDWLRANPGRPAPCSAKSIYRIADRLDLPELKERAAQHIMKSLTVDNIGYEVFSPFAAAFDAVRKVEVDFFLSHWHEIRSSETMKNVWLQIRNGRHPGFEEVWPLIAQRLEFKPSTPGVSPSAKNPEQAS
ncbi:hypothetical protein CPB84DRAFT_1674055 [Gymnopilus junonius]|uniref:MATH domain-containing protein n=1 Tax=Gymnopilus junonius TaxID=109634 RepID=A0A9P5TT56_GYMJU|nr:hypothetical protein CPB84DRAFT_1674055 [Gymnopilus junonius]